MVLHKNYISNNKLKKLIKYYIEREQLQCCNCEGLDVEAKDTLFYKFMTELKLE